MGGWLAQCADLLKPLYGSLKEILLQFKVIGTDDTSVKVRDIKLPFARTGRIWPYYGDSNHPVILMTTRRRGSVRGRKHSSKDIAVRRLRRV